MLSTAAVTVPYLVVRSVQSHHGSFGGWASHSRYHGATWANSGTLVSGSRLTSESPRSFQVESASREVRGPGRLFRRRTSGAMLNQIQDGHDRSGSPPAYQKFRALEYVMAGTMAFKWGGCSMAASHWTAPG